MGKRARTFLFLLTAVPLGAAGGAVLLAGWILVACLAITPLVVPALIAFRAAVGGVAWLEARLANALLGTELDPPLASPAARGYWSRVTAIAGDRTFWKQQAYLLERCTLGFAAAVAAASMLAAGLGALATPIDYRWTTPDVGHWHVRSFDQALLWVPPALVVLVLLLALLGPLGSASRSLAGSLLTGQAAPVPHAVIFARRRRAFAWHTAVFVALNALFILVWGTTTAAYFWPEWPLLALGLILSTHALVLAVDERADRLRARGIPLAVAIDAGVVSLLALFETCIWALTSRGYFWPAWSFLGFAVVVGVHALVARRSGSARRIAVLETTRAGAVDQQDSELRRIERDLHDGAQARLVALGMSLGMAEQKLAFDPGAAATLLAEARQSAHDALEELRDLARGIHPPVLADRGLEAAISALASRSPQPVELTVNLPTRPAPAVETAVYFVVAESLANAGKHAAASRVDVDIHARAKALVVDITDDGPGGADPAGSGLRGLARRVEALDGTLAVTSPEGGPTTIEAVIPCAW